MTLSSIANQVCSKVGKTDSNSLTQCKTYCAKNYEWIWGKCNWTEAQIFSSGTMASGTNTYTVPATIELVSMVVWWTYPLRNVSVTDLFRMRPDWQTSTGQPRMYINLPKSGTSCVIQLDVSPTSTQTITIVGKKLFVPLVNDSDVPLLRNIDNTLLAYTEGDMCQYAKQAGTAKDMYAKGQNMLQEMIDLEIHQQTKIFQIMPVKLDWDLNDLVTTTQGMTNDTYFLRGTTT